MQFLPVFYNLEAKIQNDILDSTRLKISRDGHTRFLPVLRNLQLKLLGAVTSVLPLSQKIRDAGQQCCAEMSYAEMRNLRVIGIPADNLRLESFKLLGQLLTIRSSE